jgi:hypothetical protein
MLLVSRDWRVRHMQGRPMSAHRWRVGRKLGRTLYLDDVLQGIMDSPDIAARICAAMNALMCVHGLPFYGPCDACANRDEVKR